MYIFLHEYILKAMNECEDEIEKREYCLKTGDYTEQEYEPYKNDIRKFKSIKTSLEKLYEKAKTFDTY